MEKTAIITGGASGIGLAIAGKFVHNGIKTVLVGRDSLKLKKACEELGELSDYNVFDLEKLEKIRWAGLEELKRSQKLPCSLCQILHHL